MNDEDRAGGKATGTPPSVEFKLKHQRPMVLSLPQGSQCLVPPSAGLEEGRCPEVADGEGMGSWKNV